VPSTPKNSIPSKGWPRDLFLQDANSLTYSHMVEFRRRSMRNRSWGRLTTEERGLYRCALWVARARNKITNTRLIMQVLRIALKLLENFRGRIVRAVRTRAVMMYDEYARPGGVFSWAPRMRELLHDRRYILYLGILEVNA
jgi:hypothetical protein